jgi:hypothetical protein
MSQPVVISLAVEFSMRHTSGKSLSHTVILNISH